MKCIADSASERCVNCGWTWNKGRPFPRRNCPNPPDLRPAADRLGVPDPIPPGMAQRLAAWQAAGFPERENAAELARVLCEKRKPSGLCTDGGCGKDRETAIYCLWLARMATAACPRGLF